MNLTLKNIKTFNGNEGPGFSATLYIGGRKAGDVVDDANGGEYRYHVSREDHEALLAYAGSLHRDREDSQLSPESWARCNLDSIIAKIVDETLMEKSMQRRCSSAVCYRLKGDKPGAFLRVAPKGGKKAIRDRDAWVTKTIEKVRERHGDKIEVIYNEKYSKAAAR